MANRDLYAAFARNVRERAAANLERERTRGVELRTSVLDALRSIVVDARREGLCGRVWLFGSFAWGVPGETSDVDLLAEDTRDPDRLAAVVANACGREVHVVRRDRAPEPLVARAVAEGVPV